jgi:exodeoxyribonuclease-3
VRIATWNVNSIGARLPYVLGWLGARQPDVVCLQELKAETESFPHLALRAAGYHATVHGQPRWNGVAVLSREPATLVQLGLPGADAAGARLVTVEVGGWRVSSVYVPNGKDLDHPDYQGKLDWLAQLREYLRSTHDFARPLVVAGDFNVTPCDLDTHDPDGLRGQIHHSEPERAALQAVLNLGLRDLLRDKHEDARAFSWWDYRAGSFHRNLGLRIDLLIGSPTVAATIDDVWVDREWRKKRDELTPSDHAPVVADLR